MDPFGPKYQDQVLPRIFDAEHINKLQQFEWSIVQCNITVPGDYNGSPKRKKSYSQSGFANASKRLLDNYKFFIGKI
jgi:hypothetical protein